MRNSKKHLKSLTNLENEMINTTFKTILKWWKDIIKRRVSKIFHLWKRRNNRKPHKSLSKERKSDGLIQWLLLPLIKKIILKLSFKRAYVSCRKKIKITQLFENSRIELDQNGKRLLNIANWSKSIGFSIWNDLIIRKSKSPKILVN